MHAKASKERKKEKKIALPVYAQGILTLEDLVQDSFEGKIGYAQRYGSYYPCIILDTLSLHFYDNFKPWYMRVVTL